MTLTHIYLGCILLSAIAASWYWKGLKRMQLSLFIPYLWYVSIQEVLLTILYDHKIITTTAVFYNIYRPVSATFFFTIFYKFSSNNPQVRKLMTKMYILYLIFMILDYTFVQPIHLFARYPALATGFLLSCFALLFLFNYFNLDNSRKEFQWFPVIPITVGMLAFYPVVNISFAFHSYLLYSEALLFGTKLYNIIPQIMSIFMYSCFTYAFYLCQKKN
jgi:hypothetical protein